MSKSMLDKILKVMVVNNDFEDRMAGIFLQKCKEYNDYEEIIDAIDEKEFSLFGGCIEVSTYHRETYWLFRNYFDEIFEIINDDFEDWCGEKYNGELDFGTLVWTAFALLTDRWYDAIVSLIEELA